MGIRQENMGYGMSMSRALERINKDQLIDFDGELKDYIKEYNKSGNYNYVLAYSEGPLSPVLLANESLDITKDILEGINAQYRAKKKK